MSVSHRHIFNTGLTNVHSYILNQITMFYTFLLHLHSALRYLSLLLLLLSFIIGIAQAINRSGLSLNVRRIYLWTVIFLNAQLVIGLIMYVLRGYYTAWANMQNMGSIFNFFGVEHFTGMLIAISLINIGYHSAIKRSSGRSAHKRIAVFYGIGFLMIFMLIPWPFLHSWATWF